MIKFLFSAALLFIQFSAFAAECVTHSISLNNSVTGTLETSDCRVSDVLASSDSSLVDVYEFELTAADNITITMTSEVIDPFLRLLSGDLATTFAEDDDSGTGFNALITASLDAGTYKIIANSATSQSETGSYTITLEGTATLAPSRLINISTRGLVRTGDEVMIGGLVIQGDEPKTVIIRAIGPNLANFGVQGVLMDPTMQLFSGADLIDQNDDWDQHARAADIPAGLVPTFQQEPVIVATLAPGAYTAIVRGVGETTGVALVEVFEADAVIATRLVNISTRGYVGTGDDVMIGGLVISGETPKTVAIRAVGPSLANFGVPGTLADPTLQLFSGADLIDENDNWGTHANSAQVPVSLQPADSRESVIVTTLSPGAYTAIVRGAGETTGIGLIEVFEL